MDPSEILRDDSFVQFDSDCVRKRANWSKSADEFKFDGKHFDPAALLAAIPSHSPKLQSLLDKISALDDADHKRDGKYYKHFIFCDVKASAYGAKLLAAALMATGMTMGYKADKIMYDDDDDDDGEEMEGGSSGKKKRKRFDKIKFVDNLPPHRSFFLLSSVAVYDQPISVAMKKTILQTFNQRPANVHGKNIRFIIMDSGFKEGIDLFDVKYIHIFEPSVNAADQKQVIGRGTRTCGQEGLKFHPTQGWPLYVFIYDLSVPEKLRDPLSESISIHDLYLKSLNIDLRMFTFQSELEDTVMYGAVDRELTENIHSFAAAAPSLEEERVGGDRNGLSLLGSLANTLTRPHEAMSFKEMQEYIRQHFRDAAWQPAKMENMCAKADATKADATKVDATKADADATKAIEGGAGGNIITYSPTQDFVSRYFTPQAPVKGMLLWHSVGVGKTCSAIAAASASFEPQNYTILWVTRTTLKTDIWKNMFDQVCSADIRDKIQRDGLKIPDAYAKRVRLLSKAWRIRPMSYKQFSNLVTKDNANYKTLEKINGAADPLRKTLLIIDEAHKLYGGGDAVLSALEKPDMEMLHKSIMNSYAVSGQDSVRLLLMTATPITDSPLEMVKLINLCKPSSQQLPTEFPTFSAAYLDDNGRFTAKGRSDFLDQIAGNVSYLNRTKDARQFAQPRIQHVMVPIVPNSDDVLSLDRRLVRAIHEKPISALKKRFLDENAKIDADMKDLHSSRFQELTRRCDKFSEDKQRSKMCKKLSKAAIKDLVKEARNRTKKITSDVKELRKEMKAANVIKKDDLKRVNRSNKKTLKEYAQSSFYQLKYKCGKKIRPETKFREFAETDSVVVGLNGDIEAYGDRIQELKVGLSFAKKEHRVKLKEIQQAVAEEKDADQKKAKQEHALATLRSSIKSNKQVVNEEIRNLTKKKKHATREKKSRFREIRKELKQAVRESKKAQREVKKQEQALRKTLKKQDRLHAEITSDTLRDMVQRYGQELDQQLRGL